MNLNSPISEVPFVGPYFVQRLKKIGVTTVDDLIHHFPTRYENFSLQSDIATAQSGETVTIKGQITSIKNIYTKYGKKIQTAVVSDGEGQIDVTWFNQTYLPKSLPSGTWVSLSGKISAIGRSRKMISPQWEKIGNRHLAIGNSETLHTGRLVPIYPETSGLSSKWLRNRIAFLLSKVINEIDDYLPPKIIEKNSFLGLKDSICKIHFPENYKEADEARRRLGFDEFFEIQLNTLFRKQSWKQKMIASPLIVNQEKILHFIESLPFSLTQAQTKAIREILSDLEKDQAMNRLLEGDVGSGKTVVAAIACLVAIDNGFQAVIMAPTQILATQHHSTLRALLKPQGVSVALVTSETKKPGNKRNKEQIVVGTHALLHNTDFKRLGVVVIDEQHRFGVKQRALLAQSKDGKAPHILTMTATPIPRTVVLTVYGDLDLSVLDEMPKGRINIKTWVVPPQKRTGAYKWIRERVKDTDEQAFIVCPLIEQSEKETMKSVKAASVEFEKLRKEIFPDLRLELLHGRIRGKEKDKIMHKFKAGDVDILVATPVVEVGIDIPTATIMMIEASERFGLAQLHQLRGRVGRGVKQSYCLLMTDSKNTRVLQRLRALERDLSGAELAQLDLELRGPGEIFGTAQSGFPELKVGDFSNFELIKTAREAAEGVMPNIKKYPKILKILEKSSSILPN